MSGCQAPPFNAFLSCRTHRGWVGKSEIRNPKSEIPRHGWAGIPNSEFLIRNWVYLREEDLCSEP